MGEHITPLGASTAGTDLGAITVEGCTIDPVSTLRGSWSEGNFCITGITTSNFQFISRTKHVLDVRGG